MFDTFKVINEPEQFRIVNLIKDLRLPTKIIQNVLDLSSDQIAHHLSALQSSGVIQCDLSSPLDMCRVNQSHVNEHILFHALMSKLMSSAPLYQADRIKLNQLMPTK